MGLGLIILHVQHLVPFNLGRSLDDDRFPVAFTVAPELSALLDSQLVVWSPIYLFFGSRKGTKAGTNGIDQLVVVVQALLKFLKLIDLRVEGLLCLEDIRTVEVLVPPILLDEYLHLTSLS